MLRNLNKIYLVGFYFLILACSKKTPEPAEIIEEIIHVDPSPTPPSSDPAGDTPNILFIIADDMGIDATPRYGIGSNLPSMPTLTSWMDNGIRFSNVWTNPVCSPTRAAILTGKFGYRTGVLITSVDLFSTFLTITGNTQHESHDSQNFLPLLTTAGAGTRNFNYTEYLGNRPNQSGYTLRNSSYKLIVFDNGNQALYNLENDPYESNNLMNANLSDDAQVAYQALMEEAVRIRQ